VESKAQRITATAAILGMQLEDFRAKGVYLSRTFVSASVGTGKRSALLDGLQDESNRLEKQCKLLKLELSDTTAACDLEQQKATLAKGACSKAERQVAQLERSLNQAREISAERNRRRNSILLSTQQVKKATQQLQALHAALDNRIMRKSQQNIDSKVRQLLQSFEKRAAAQHQKQTKSLQETIKRLQTRLKLLTTPKAMASPIQRAGQSLLLRPSSPEKPLTARLVVPMTRGYTKGKSTVEEQRRSPHLSNIQGSVQPSPQSFAQEVETETSEAVGVLEEQATNASEPQSDINSLNLFNKFPAPSKIPGTKRKKASDSPTNLKTVAKRCATRKEEPERQQQAERWSHQHIANPRRSSRPERAAKIQAKKRVLALSTDASWALAPSPSTFAVPDSPKHQNLNASTVLFNEVERQRKEQRRDELSVQDCESPPSTQRSRRARTKFGFQTRTGLSTTIVRREAVKTVRSQGRRNMPKYRQRASVTMDLFDDDFSLN